jgi:glycosyltransferase involved in cell wall biosynthesis
MSRKKILYIITKGNFGGAQRYVFDLATNLAKDKFETIVALGEGETLEKKLKDAGIRVIKIHALGRNMNFTKDIVSFFEIVKIIRNEKPDIVHLNSSKAGGIGALAVRIRNLVSKSNTQAIFTGHGWAFNEERNIFSKAIIAILHWFTILLSHKTIAVSEKIKSQIKIFPFIKQKIVCIHNGIKPITFFGKEDARERLIPHDTSPLWIGMIAELHKNKGVDFAIEAFATIAQDFPDSKLIIIGEGEERKNLEKRIAELELNERILLLGFIRDANTYLKAFDIGLCTSRTDTFPYVPLEMGLAGVPVIASWVGGIPEIIVSGESGILNQKGDIDGIARSIVELIQDDVERNTLIKNLEERVRNEFTFSKMLEKTEAVYSA